MFAPLIQHLMVKGISEYTVLLLLFLPVITTCITVARYIIGWRSINIYTSVLLVYALFDLGYLQNGSTDYPSTLFYGGMLIFVTSTIGIIFNTFVRELRMHYLSKVSIVMSFVTIGVIIFMYAATFMRTISLTAVKPLTLAIFIIAVEALVKSYIRHGIKKAIQLMISTVLLTYTIFFLMSQQFLQNALLDYPEISLLMIALSFLVGRWRGLKLIEYLRFRSILGQDPYDAEDFS